MTQRSPLAVFLLSLVTCGLYWLYWTFATTSELNASGTKVPHAILSLVPLVNLWWLWRYSNGVAEVTRGEWSALGSFALMLFLPGVGAAVLQAAFNRTVATPVPAPA